MRTPLLCGAALAFAGLAGTRVTTRRQWDMRRQQMRRSLCYYAVGQMPPAPGNVKGREIRSEVVLDGTVPRSRP